jgi:glucose-6-phosphate isomerase
MPKHPLIKYDHANMRSGAVGKAGQSPAQFSRLLKRLAVVHRAMKDHNKKGGYGFTTIPYRAEELAEVRRLAASLKKEFKTLIVVGIGGSDLGARALVAALASKKKGAMDIRFIGANTDPDELNALLASVDLKKCAINIISKSGDTVEPMSAFLILRQRLIARVGMKRHARHVIATTDPDHGTLRAIADKEGYRALPVPRAIGGRFSTLTTVGLLAVECAGIDGKALLHGAERVLLDFIETSPEQNGSLLFAGLLTDAHTLRGQNVAVFMPYASRLRQFGNWFRQLWAESLGKRRTRHGKAVHAGQTPVAALGATDQHSQLQLWNDGPADTVVTFLDHGAFDTDLAVPAAYPKLAGVNFLGKKTLSRINRAERESTALALTEHDKPNGTLRIARVDAASLGGLMMFFMLATAAAGELLDIDAFDQPGVESMKKTMFRMLGKKKV